MAKMNRPGPQGAFCPRRIGLDPIVLRMRKIKSGLLKRWHHLGTETESRTERTIMRQATRRQAAGRAVRGEEGK